MGIVIDTNVLEHADNGQEERRLSSIKLIDHLRNTKEIVLYVDQSLDINNSYVLSEYFERLKPGMYGHTMLIELLQQNRVTPLNRTVVGNVMSKIKQWVHKVTDVAFARITYKSAEKILVSHDYEDFPRKARKFLRNELNIEVIEAAECNID